MANRFETFTKTLADDKLSRRRIVKKAVGATATAVVGAMIPKGEAFAAISHRSHFCRHYNTCSGVEYFNCAKWGNSNCYCFQKLGFTTGVCGCNSYCASVPPCSSQSNCASGYVCITNTGCGCTTGLCVQKCNKTCTLASNGAGRTAA